MFMYKKVESNIIFSYLVQYASVEVVLKITKPDKCDEANGINKTWKLWLPTYVYVC